MNDKKGWDNAFTADSPYGTVKGSPSYAGALSFMRRPYSRKLEGVDVAVTGIPLDTATTHRPGARFGSRAIRAASTCISWERPWPWDFDPLERLAVVDYGDCEFDPGLPDTVVPFVERWFDCLDPAFAPGTGTPVCGGLSTFQVLEIIRGLAGINLVGMDVVEVAPAYDVGEITALAGATLAAELLCLFAANKEEACESRNS